MLAAVAMFQPNLTLATPEEQLEIVVNETVAAHCPTPMLSTIHFKLWNKTQSHSPFPPPPVSLQRTQANRSLPFPPSSPDANQSYLFQLPVVLYACHRQKQFLSFNPTVLHEALDFLLLRRSFKSKLAPTSLST